MSCRPTQYAGELRSPALFSHCPVLPPNILYYLPVYWVCGLSTSKECSLSTETEAGVSGAQVDRAQGPSKVVMVKAS